MARLGEALTVDFSTGMIDSTAPARYPKSSVRLITNGRIQPDGTIRRRPGSIRTSAVVANAETGWGGILFRTAAGTDQLIVFLGDTAYKSTDYGETLTPIVDATGLREDYYSFAIMRVGAVNYLYCANGDTTVKKYDGATWGTIAAAPAGVKYIAEFNRRLYATGHSGVLVQASKIADPETWASPDGLTVQVDDVPTGLFRTGSHLLVFDRKSTSYIDGYGEQTLIVADGATGFSNSVGCVAFRSIAAVGDNGACWLSERGVEYYVPGSGIKLISKGVQGFMSELDWEQLYGSPGLPTAVYDGIDQNYWLALPTNGVQNNRLLILNILQQDIQTQRSGVLAAASIDQFSSAGGGELLFAGDTDGYLGYVPGGYELTEDASGYVALDTAGAGGDPTAEDAEGYLSAVTNDTLPSSLFLGPSTDRANVVYSAAYDGWVRRHYDVDSDDMDLAGTGGTAVTMVVRSQPFLYGRPGQRKRVRTVHVASIQSADATVTALVYGRGVTTAPVTFTMSALGTDHAFRTAAKVKIDADAPQVEVRTSGDVRLAMCGVSAELLRERR